MPASVFLDKLARLRANNCEELPPPELAVLTRMVARLRREGLQSGCLQVGETAPDFELTGASAQHFYTVLERGPVVLNFFRGLWCPYCRTELEAYENIRPELTRLGCAYFAISPQRPDTALPDCPVIFDRDNRIARQFGIVYALDSAEQALFRRWGLMLDEVNDSPKWELPVPAVFVVCKDRRIGYEYVDVDFRARCCPEQLIEELKIFCGC